MTINGRVRKPEGEFIHASDGLRIRVDSERDEDFWLELFIPEAELRASLRMIEFEREASERLTLDELEDRLRR